MKLMIISRLTGAIRGIRLSRSNLSTWYSFAYPIPPCVITAVSHARSSCANGIASSCCATIVEVEQPAEPLAALDRRIAVGRSLRLLGPHEQPVADTLVVPLAVI